MAQRNNNTKLKHIPDRGSICLYLLEPLPLNCMAPCVNQLRSQLYQQQVMLILHSTLAASQKVNLSKERGMRRPESFFQKQNKKTLDEQKYKHSFQSFQMFSFTDRKRLEFTFEADCSSILRNPTMAISVV